MYFEEDPASASDGRERPWRARLISFSLEDSADSPAVAQLASRLLTDSMREAVNEDRARYLARRSEYPADWRAASGEVFSVAHVTPGELDRLRARVLEVMAPYIRLDPGERPPGALPVRVMLDLFPWFGPEDA